MLFLIGLPAVGKTYWARKLSSHFSLPYADLDTYIEQQTNKTISQIFADEGEVAFRLKESELLKTLIQTSAENTIIACGGGTPAFYNNLKMMKSAGCVVYLKNDVESILKRIDDRIGERPLLASNNPLQILNELFAERKYIYEQADYILDAATLTVANFTEIISICTNKH